MSEDKVTPEMGKAGVEFAMKAELTGDYGWREYVRDLYLTMDAHRPDGDDVERVARAICWADTEDGAQCASRCMNANKCMADKLTDSMLRDARAAISAIRGEG